MRKIEITLAILFSIYLHANGLILSGVDTVHTYREAGFDFITQQACTTSSFSAGYDCNNHFEFFYYSYTKQFALNSYSGYGYQAGKVNLDSIKTAPPDSIFNKLSLHIDSLPQDSLRDFIGNCYIIKTGNDPRPAWSGVYYAKIKILNFKVIDSALHKVDMAFLWACQPNLGRNLTTTGLDTFNLNPQTRSKYNITLSLRSSQSVFKVLGDRFTVPTGSNIRPGAVLSVYDLLGKRLGSAVVGRGGVVDLREVRRGGVRGVVVVRE